MSAVEGDGPSVGDDEDLAIGDVLHAADGRLERQRLHHLSCDSVPETEQETRRANIDSDPKGVTPLLTTHTHTRPTVWFYPLRQRGSAGRRYTTALSLWLPCDLRSLAALQRKHRKCHF